MFSAVVQGYQPVAPSRFRCAVLVEKPCVWPGSSGLQRPRHFQRVLHRKWWPLTRSSQSRCGLTWSVASICSKN